jgi:hypothetical protein
MTAMKVKIAHQEGWDIHDFGFAHRDDYLAQDLFAGYTPISQPEITFSPDLRPSAYNTAARLRLEGVSVHAEDGPGPPEIRLKLRRDKRKFYRNYERHGSPVVMGSKF